MPLSHVIMPLSHVIMPLSHVIMPLSHVHYHATVMLSQLMPGTRDKAAVTCDNANACCHSCHSCHVIMPGTHDKNGAVSGQ